jgi:hypothetical protein
MNAMRGISKQVMSREGRIGRVWFKHGKAGSVLRARSSQLVIQEVSRLQPVGLDRREAARVVEAANAEQEE